MKKPLRLLLAQLDFTVGDIAGNCQRILATIETAKHDQSADVIVFPELAITGYPPEDLLLRPDFLSAVDKALEQICQATDTIDVLIGHPQKINNHLYNAASWFHQGRCLAVHHKIQLPNTDVFDECRYFTPGHSATVVEVLGHRIGLLICEDIWHTEPVEKTKALNIDLCLVINASPFSIQKSQQRQTLLSQQTQLLAAPLIYVNHIGGQDDLLFDGEAMVFDAAGEMVYHTEPFHEQLYLLNFDEQMHLLNPRPATTPEISKIYQGLVLSIRDYIEKNGFPGVIIGLSGGIDSALTLVLAVDALGKDRVQAVMMPSQYTAQMSLEDAEELAHTLGVDYQVISIEPIFEGFLTQLSDLFSGYEPDKTEENLQARIRGTLLMALSNKTGRLVLATGNKSEMAVGYCTLYGDMVGGFAVLKDVYKTLVYQLVAYRNQVNQLIPERICTRPPSAELAPDQTDQDTLPAYDILDKIIFHYVEEDLAPAEIIALGFSESDVRRVVSMIQASEYKRFQAAPGPKITHRAFTRSRRYPMTSKFK